MLSHEQRFQDNVNAVCEISENIEKVARSRGIELASPLMISLTKEIIKVTPQETLVTMFVRHSHTFWASIFKRDESFFKTNFFPELPFVSQVLSKVLSDEYDPPIISPELKDELWRIFGGLVRISIRFIHERRGPALKEVGDGQWVPKYEREFLPQVQLESAAKEWGVKLVFAS